KTFTKPEDRNVFSYVMEKHQKTMGRMVQYLLIYPIRFCIRKILIRYCTHHNCYKVKPSNMVLSIGVETAVLAWDRFIGSLMIAGLLHLGQASITLDVGKHCIISQNVSMPPYSFQLKKKTLRLNFM